MQWQSPTLSLQHVEPVRADGLLPTLRLGMLVQNPNGRPLRLRGMSYSVALQGFEVISGSSNAIPVIPAQGSALVQIDAKLGLLESAQLVSMLLSRPQRELGFSLAAELDTGLPLFGIVPVRQNGVIDMETWTATLN